VPPIGDPIDDPRPSAVKRFDRRVDEAWGRLRGNPLADRAFYLASELGDFSLIWLLIGAAQGVRSDEEADASIRLALLLLAESALVNQGIKRVVRRPRPDAGVPHPHRLRTPRTSSFPSGHASSAAAAATLLSARHPRRAPLYWGIAAVVATSRIHVQVHHASDVIAGAAVGVAFARVAQRVWPAPRA
jgi:undecaprenyl-diphosphatase